ncbi:Dal82p SCDLUD_005010 [Saccharomycodes ludwigii]|uniref:Dal82p n=1 Tax=Saccharomycodes ludwigii TaxID=36035 RepID=UPI001E852421|nr:hypothetical protein SCDLUD_005010 [Saccharomycodes ludwigii]KAH3898687.1 hypothetical protein SCDLUD_005010 [Saccharomycodes ludwigii]
MVEHHDALLIEIMDTYKPHLKIYSLRLKTWQTVLDIYNQRANTNYKQTRTLKNRFLKLKAKLDYQDPHLSSLLNGEENVVLLEKLVAEHVAFQDKRMPGYYTKAEKDELRNGTNKHYHSNNINNILNNDDNNNNNNNVTDNGERKRKLNNTDNNTGHDNFNNNHDNISEFPLSKQQQRQHKNTEQKHSHIECSDTDEFGTPMELHLREKFDNEEKSEEDENEEEEKKESSRKIENEKNNPTSNSDNNYIMERDSVEAPPLDGITILPHTEYQKQHQNDSLSSTGSAAARQDSMTNTNVSFSPTYETQSNSYNNNNNNTNNTNNNTYNNTNNNSVQSNDDDCDNINSPISIIQNRLLHKVNQANQNLFTTTADNILQEVLNLINNKNNEDSGKIDIDTVRSLIRSEIKSELEPITDAQNTFKNTVLSEIENIKKLLILLTNNSLRSYSHTTDNSTSSFSEKYTKEST